MHNFLQAIFSVWSIIPLFIWQFKEQSTTHILSFNRSHTHTSSDSLHDFPRTVPLSEHCWEKKRDSFVYQSHILLCDIALLSFYPPLQAVARVCFSTGSCLSLASCDISQCVCVCDKISPVNTLDQMTRPHTLLSRTHYLSHTHTHRTLSSNPGLSRPPPSLIRVFVGVSDVLFIVDLQCVCRAVEGELILCW